jgi:hypothetical protein
MAGQVSEESAHVGTQDHEPEAFEQQEEGRLTQAEFAARVAAKREQAAQDGGFVEPPGADAPLTPEAKAALGITDEAVPPPVVEETDEDLDSLDDEDLDQRAEVEQEEGESDEDFYVRRYKTREDAEIGFAEKDATIERQFRELQELRERNEAIEQAVDAEPQQLDVQAWREWAEEQVENGLGERGAMAALAEGGEDGYDIYISAWQRSEDEEQRAIAFAFNNKVQRAFAERRVAAAMEAREPDRTPTEEAQLAQQRTASLYPDFDEYKEQMDRVATEPGLIPESTKAFLRTLANEGGLEGKAQVWDYLYQRAKALGAPKRAQAAQVERRQRRASADAAKTSAMVSSAEGTPTRTPLTEAEQEVIRYKNERRERWGLELLEEE